MSRTYRKQPSSCIALRYPKTQRLRSQAEALQDINDFIQSEYNINLSTRSKMKSYKAIASAWDDIVVSAAFELDHN